MTLTTLSEAVKFKLLKNVGYHTFTKLYDTDVNSILNYGPSIKAFEKDKYRQQIQYRATRYFLGVHKNGEIHALQADMGWVNVKYHFYLCTLQLVNRLV